MNMAAFAAENRKTGYSPSVTTTELDEFILEQKPLIIDVRDVFAFDKSNVEGSYNVPLEVLPANLHAFPRNRSILVYDETGKKGHQALRMIKGAGIENVFNVSGGHISMQRHQRAMGFSTIKLELLPVEEKSLEESASTEDEVLSSTASVDANTPLVVDVRTPEEFRSGAYPGAINISLDELQQRIDELGAKDREITLYCASGARSAYAQRVLQHFGFSNVRNGGGLMQMMMRR